MMLISPLVSISARTGLFLRMLLIVMRTFSLAAWLTKFRFEEFLSVSGN